MINNISKKNKLIKPKLRQIENLEKRQKIKLYLQTRKPFIKTYTQKYLDVKTHKIICNLGH